MNGEAKEMRGEMLAGRVIGGKLTPKGKEGRGVMGKVTLGLPSSPGTAIATRSSNTQ